MTALLDRHVARQEPTPSQRLRCTMAAARVSLSWLGVHKTLTTQQKAQAAEAFGAEGQFLSAGKKLLDTRHPAFKAVTAVKHRIRSYWKGLSLPYPEPGIRLIRQDGIESFDSQMAIFREELNDAVEQLEEHYSELQALAQERLGSLYNRADYPPEMRGLFAVEWDFPSVEPPDYLRQLSPELYEQEKARVTAKFDEAVQLAEQAFASEFASLVSHLAGRLSGQEDGSPKVFRDSAVTRLVEFFERFRSLNVRSCAELDKLIFHAQEAIRGVEPQELRDNASLRYRVANELTGVRSELECLLVERPRRNILRRSNEGSSHGDASPAST